MTNPTTFVCAINPETGLLRETEKAFGLHFGTFVKGKPQVDCWLPKSQVSLENNILRCPMWLARKNGMLAWLKLPNIDGLIWVE